jgi:hypothetical protein
MATAPSDTRSLDSIFPQYSLIVLAFALGQKEQAGADGSGEVAAALTFHDAST